MYIHIYTHIYQVFPYEGGMGEETPPAPALAENLCPLPQEKF